MPWYLDRLALVQPRNVILLAQYLTDPAVPGPLFTKRPAGLNDQDAKLRILRALWNSHMPEESSIRKEPFVYRLLKFAR